MSLAAKLPYDHPYAGGFSGIGSQPLPTDSDCLTYLAAVKAADGAGVEVSVATAVDAFFRDTKAAGLFDALKACCILAGARTLAGALVPVVGDAPNNVADGFVEGDYSRTDGLTGDGTSYLDSGRANNADPQDDNHNSVYIQTAAPSAGRYIGAENVTAGTNNIVAFGGSLFFRNRTSAADSKGSSSQTGFMGFSRAGAAGYTVRSSSSESVFTRASQAPVSTNVYVFGFNDTADYSTAKISFYSIGTAVDLEALDTAVTNLITAIGEAL
jgi:hypothetical protein